MVVQGATLTADCNGKILVGFVIETAQLDSVAGNRVKPIYSVFIYEMPGRGVYAYDATPGCFVAVDAGT